MGIKEKHARSRPLPAELETRLQALPSVLERQPVRLAYLFGSAARNASEAGDVDLAVVPADGFSHAALYTDLSLFLGTDRLDIIDLRSATPLLRWEAVRGIRLYGRSEAEAAAYEQRVRDLYRDDTPVLRSLGEMDRVAQELEKYRHVDAEELGRNLSLRWTVERGLLAGLTLLFQVTEHILAAHFHRYPETYEASLLELREQGVILGGLYDQLRGSGGFRNILVHEYVQIDLREVEAVLRKAPLTFRPFAVAISSWLPSAA